MSVAILTGAGFSRNWGGLLATELADHLAANNKLDGDLRRELFECRDFESILSRMQRNQVDFDKSANFIRCLEESLVFHDDLIRVSHYESCRLDGFIALLQRLRDRSMASISWFTLNYDLLVERHLPEHWRSTFCLPEVSDWIAPVEGKFRPHQQIIPEQQCAVLSNHEKCIAYYKLHGSMSWRTPDGAMKIIAGGDKESQAIGLLDSYRKAWKQAIRTGDTVIVIGYSFGDAHINRQLAREGLKIHVVDPAGINNILGRLRDKSYPEFGQACLRKVLSNVQSVWTRSLPEMFPVGHIGSDTPLALEFATTIERFL